MVCAAASLHGVGYKPPAPGTPVTDEESSAQSGSSAMLLPEYIRRAWGVPAVVSPPPPPPPVRLSGALNAVRHVLLCILEARVAVGDAYVANLNRARSGRKTDVWNSATIVPMPRQPQQVPERDYFRIQAVHGLNPTVRSVFCDGTLPKISLIDYVTRFFSHPPVPNLSTAVYILMVVYLDRVMARCPGLFLHSFNAHRMVLGAFVVAAKYHEDEYVLQTAFAKHGGVTPRELCDIERTFLQAMDYRCFLSKEHFEAQEIEVMQEALEGPSGPRLLALLRAERVVGMDLALSQINTRGTRSQPPRALAAPLQKGDVFQGILMTTDAEAGVFNMLLEQKQVELWNQRRQRMAETWVDAHSRALVEDLFPPGWAAGGARTRTRQRATTGGWYHVQPQQQAAPQSALLEHSTVIAKSAVSFILNDNDPFADLNTGAGCAAGARF